MKLSYVRCVSAFVALAALAVAGRAQEIDQISVNIPHDFVVAGKKTLPAGTYRVNRANDRDVNELVITSVEKSHGCAAAFERSARNSRRQTGAPLPTHRRPILPQPDRNRGTHLHDSRASQRQPGGRSGPKTLRPPGPVPEPTKIACASQETHWLGHRQS